MKLIWNLHIYCFLFVKLYLFIGVVRLASVYVRSECNDCSRCWILRKGKQFRRRPGIPRSISAKRHYSWRRGWHWCFREDGFVVVVCPTTLGLFHYNHAPIVVGLLCVIDIPLLSTAAIRRQRGRRMDEMAHHFTVQLVRACTPSAVRGGHTDCNAYRRNVSAINFIAK